MCRKWIGFASPVLVLILVGSASADLVAHWEFNEGSGSVARDASGNGHDGTINGTPRWVPGKIGRALEFDGSNYVDIPSGVTDLSDSFTITAWIKTSRIGMCILSKSDGNTAWGSQEKQFYVADPALEGQSDGGVELVGWGCDWVRNDDTVPVIDDAWHHVSVTWEAGSAEGLIYVDGENRTGNETYSGCPDNANDTIRIGFSPGEHSANFVGLIDDVRIYNHPLTQEEIAEVMKGAPGAASNPVPENEAGDVALDRALSWIPGEFANTHDVYLGTSFDDVNAASTDNPLGVLVGQGQSGSAFDPGRLPFSETYYWRVDEVNGAPDFTIFKGVIWSFTVEPLAIPISSITATASGSFGASGPERTIDGSGLVDDLHGVSPGDMWISAGIPATIEYAFDRAYKLHELWIWNSNQAIEVFVGFGAKVVVIEHSLDAENWTVLEGVGPLAPAPGAAGYVHNNTVDFGGATAQHVRLTIESVQGIAPQASLSEVRFLAIPTFANRPNPDSGATNVAPDTTLSWGRNGREADRHEVYVGTHADDLARAGAAMESSFDTLALDLQLGQSYTWRVDEVNDVEDPSTWKGTVWSFTTADSISIDDMESYRDEEFLEIWATWIDGFEDPANGSLVGNGASGSPETGIVHAGGQSLPLDFGNGGAQVSEATRTFDQAQDWTRSGVQSLVLFLNRGADNTGSGQVYVKINDTKIVYEGGADLPPGWDLWTQWTIDLSAVAADVTSVRSLTIGVEGAGARGVIYVDSIQLVGDASGTFLSWFEAESGAITAPMQVFSDNPTASAGQYIGTVDGIGDENGAPPADGIATYSLDVPEDGVYQLAVRVIITGGSNSFWLRIPGMATNTTNDASGWVRFNDISDGNAWHWDVVRSSDDGDSVVEFTLARGTHTLEIARREDGTLLDAIALMK